MGALGYADDILLIAPTRHSLQVMIKTCENFSINHSMQFSTDSDPRKSKTKCQFFTLKKNKDSSPSPVILNNDPLPWVDSAKHLGNLLTTNLNPTLGCPNTDKDLHSSFDENVQ